MNILGIVCQEITKLVPASLLSDMACYVFYDNHPKAEKNIDITVCTKTGELKEYSQRILQSSLALNCDIIKPCELRILRNPQHELFYLLTSNDKVFIISSIKKLRLHKKLTNIARCDYRDPDCTGDAILKVIRKDDAVPVLFDSNFECLEDRGVILSPHNVEDHYMIMNELKRKLVEARYAVKCNEKTYAQHLKLHQQVSLLPHQHQQPVPNNSSTLQEGAKAIGCFLKLKSHTPLVKVCNRQLVLMFSVLLVGNKPIEYIHILLCSKTIPSLVYRTKIFTKIPTPPYWQEANNSLRSEQEFVVTVVVDLEEVERNVGIIELYGSLAYRILGKECLLAFDDVFVPAIKMMGDEFDVLSSCELGDKTILAILATSQKTELRFRHITSPSEPKTCVMDMISTSLEMDTVENASNVLVYKKSPYHALYGTMLVFHQRSIDGGVPVTMYSRTPESKVTCLMHHIHDHVPAKIIVTTPEYKITAKTYELSQNSEQITPTNKQINTMDYATSMLKRSAKILEHLDESMIRMNKSKNPLIKRKVGSHIDLFAGGVERYKDFKEDMDKEAAKGIDALSEVPDESSGSDVMVID